MYTCVYMHPAVKMLQFEPQIHKKYNSHTKIDQILLNKKKSIMIYAIMGSKINQQNSRSLFLGHGDCIKIKINPY